MASISILAQSLMPIANQRADTPPLTDVVIANFTVVAAIATAFAAVFTAIAAVSSSIAASTSKEELKQTRKQTAMTQVAEYVTSLTSGDIASDRDRVAEWVHETVKEQNGIDPPTRKSYFDLLWALQRASGIKHHISLIDADLAGVLTRHLELIIDSINKVKERFPSIDDRDSWDTARETIEALKKCLPDLKEELCRAKTKTEDQAEENPNESAN